MPELPTTNSSSAGGVFGVEKVELQWMLVSLDGFIHAMEFRLATKAYASAEESGMTSATAKAKAFEVMLKAGKTLQTIVNAIDSMEAEDVKTEELGDNTQIFSWSLTGPMQKLLETTTFVDALNLTVTTLISRVVECNRQLNQATRQLHQTDSDSFWRAQLASDCKLEEIFAAAECEHGLNSVETMEVERALTQFKQDPRWDTV